MVNELLRRILFLPPQASTVASEIDHLHYFVILTTMFGAAAITVVGLVFLVRYRARGDAFRREVPAPGVPRWAEVGVIGGLLSLFCLWWVIGFWQYVKVQVPPPDAMTVYVTAKQWMWKFAYPDGEHTIATLYVPTGRPVELLLTSRDVIHSFYVPDFRIKQDAVPGRYTTIWFEVPDPGTHQIFCAEYCGTNHSEMRGQVVALSPEDYARWVGASHRAAPMVLPAQPADLISTGRAAAAELGCLRCHTLDGSPFIGPTWAGLYRSVVPFEGGGSEVADEAYLTESMMDPMAKIHLGFKPVMPSYHGTLTPGQAAAIVELIKSVRDLPERGAHRAPPPGGAPLEAPPAERAAQMENARVEAPPAIVTPTAAVSPVLPPPDQQGLPPPGLIPNPAPRLPIVVGGSVAGAAGGGADASTKGGGR